MQNTNKVTISSVVKAKDKGKIYIFAKRTFDLISASTLLVLVLPILLLITIWIKLDSKGKALFCHKRIGYNGSNIGIYKFRTMVSNAKEVFDNFTPEQKAEFEKNFKLDNDPRITKIGKFLRSTSLDELPQLLNIIKGEMSVVGPRPVVSEEIKKYGKYAEELLSVKPGLTGYWQANGRSDTTYEERVDMDMYYIRNRSLGLDLKIIFQTIISVIKKKGAV